MNLKFKAAVLFKQKKKLKIIDVEYIDKLKRGQIAVKLKFSGICGSQIGEIEGIKGKDKFLPHLLGHEGFGKVLSDPGASLEEEGFRGTRISGPFRGRKVGRWSAPGRGGDFAGPGFQVP